MFPPPTAPFPIPTSGMALETQDLIRPTSVGRRAPGMGACSQREGSMIPKSPAQPHPKLSLSGVDFSPPGQLSTLAGEGPSPVGHSVVSATAPGALPAPEQPSSAPRGHSGGFRSRALPRMETPPCSHSVQTQLSPAGAEPSLSPVLLPCCCPPARGRFCTAAPGPCSGELPLPPLARQSRVLFLMDVTLGWPSAAPRSLSTAAPRTGARVRGRRPYAPARGQ